MLVSVLVLVLAWVLVLVSVSVHLGIRIRKYITRRSISNQPFCLSIIRVSKQSTSISYCLPPLLFATAPYKQRYDSMQTSSTHVKWIDSRRTSRNPGYLAEYIKKSKLLPGQHWEILTVPQGTLRNPNGFPDKMKKYRQFLGGDLEIRTAMRRTFKCPNCPTSIPITNKNWQLRNCNLRLNRRHSLARC